MPATTVEALIVAIETAAYVGTRLMVAIVGAPGSGKSTLAETLRHRLGLHDRSAIVVPMDGFHFDDAILNARGHRPRKGAPFTYDVGGFEILLTRIKARAEDVAIPVFDRSLELSRAAADIVTRDADIVLVEGNYLLLTEPPWDRLRPLFDVTIFIDEPFAVLEQRLIQRWLGLGFDMAYAQNWIASNDALNIRTVIAASAPADYTITS
jgi:pantothenate kinase